MVLAMTTEIAAQYGLLGIVLFALGTGFWRASIWLAEHVVKPTVTAHVAFLQESIATMKAMRSELGAMTDLEEALRASIVEMELAQRDPDSVCSTIHTNHALRLFADAMVRLHQSSDMGLDKIRERIDAILSKQAPTS